MTTRRRHLEANNEVAKVRGRSTAQERPPDNRDALAKPGERV